MDGDIQKELIQDLVPSRDASVDPLTDLKAEGTIQECCWSPEVVNIKEEFRADSPDSAAMGPLKSEPPEVSSEGASWEHLELKETTPESVPFPEGSVDPLSIVKTEHVCQGYESAEENIEENMQVTASGSAISSHIKIEPPDISPEDAAGEHHDFDGTASRSIETDDCSPPVQDMSGEATTSFTQSGNGGTVLGIQGWLPQPACRDTTPTTSKTEKPRKKTKSAGEAPGMSNSNQGASGAACVTSLTLNAIVHGLTSFISRSQVSTFYWGVNN